DAGSYVCAASNSLGSTNSDPVTVTVTNVPVISTPNATINANENQQVTLTCQVTPLNSLTDLYWTKDGQRLSTTNAAKYSGGTSAVPSLTIYSLSPSDGGAYVCVATNQFGTTPSGNVTLNLQYVPRLTVTNATVTSSPGDTIILTCNVNANPNITSFSWTKSGVTISSSSNPTKYSG
ncbi:unnamed protein product, partial [Lymnaea stagnalis]